MIVNQFGPINFDGEMGPGFAIIRAHEKQVQIVMSLTEDGDYDIFLPVAQAQEVLSALQKAIDVAKGETSTAE